MRTKVLSLTALLLALLVAMSIALGGCGTAQPSKPPVAPTPPPTVVPPATASDLLEGVKAAGLPVGTVTVYTAESDAMLGRPHRYTSRVDWVDPRVPADNTDFADAVQYGGNIEVFANEDDALATRQAMETVMQGGFITEYLYQHGTALLRLSHQLTPEQAQEYEQAFIQTCDTWGK